MAMKISLAEIKKHLKINDDYDADDSIIETYYHSAVAAVMHDCDFSDEEMAYDEQGNFRPMIKQAILLLLANFYANREPEVFASPQSIGHGYQYLIMLSRDYQYRN
jgi:uncharacterized phage protein (predicted DNA packaging)